MVVKRIWYIYKDDNDNDDDDNDGNDDDDGDDVHLWR